MTISYAEPTTLTCPACGQRFNAQVWTLVDTGERPDLYEALLDGSLNQVVCPQCGQAGPAGGPLLLHEVAMRRVYFVAPAEIDEHIWREHAQALLYALVGALPEEARLPYLGDVQIAQEIDGLRQSLMRRGRRGRPAASAGSPAPSVEAQPVVAAPPPPAPRIQDSPLFDWVQQLLMSEDAAEFQAVVRAQPELLGAPAAALIEALVAEALRADEREIAQALRRILATLAELRLAEQADLVQGDLPVQLASSAPLSPLTEATYQAILAADSAAALLDAAGEHPAILEAWVEYEVGVRAEQALDDGNERLAQQLDLRREALIALRAEYASEAALLQAVQALLRAEGEEALAEVLGVYPVLLTDAAQALLLQLGSEAQAHDDPQMAAYALECRTMLREVRQRLDHGAL